MKNSGIPETISNIQSLYFLNDGKSTSFSSENALVISPSVDPEDIHVFGSMEEVAHIISTNAIYGNYNTYNV